jgi:oxygen-independent coproporphyrinogen III oxidase
MRRIVSTMASPRTQSDPQRTFDTELLRRYDVAGPRYTSYPTAPQFTPEFGEAQFCEHARRSNEVPVARPLSLYVHIPFCTNPCFYCGCNRVITRDSAAGSRYVERLRREIASVGSLFDQRREVRQLHFGGGTPNFLPAAELARLIEAFANQFHLSASSERDFSIELDPRFITDGDVKALARLGLNRASLGVQDFDRQVQEAVNRVQSVEQTLAVLDACREAGFRSVNVDLIYGLPYQTPEGFERTLRTVIGSRPDRLAVYGYAHMPQLFKAQRQIDRATLPDPQLRIALLRLAIEQLESAGYRYIGMDHFALPDDDLSRAQDSGGLHRNFMGYTTHGGCDLIGFGMSAISHVGHSFSQNARDLGTWEAALDAGRLPIWRGLALTQDDVLRSDVIQQLMCRAAVGIREIENVHGVDFGDYFADALRRLERLVEDGVVETDDATIRATARGRYLLRTIAMCFDRYLARAQLRTDSAPPSEVQVAAEHAHAVPGASAGQYSRVV